MASYSFTTTPAQEALLTWIVQQGNAQKDTTFTNAQYVQQRFPTLLAPYAEAFKKHLHDQVQQKFDAADAKTKADVLALLGVS